MIFGDFNADMFVDTYDSTQLYNFVTFSSMYLVPYRSTHHLKNSNTFLDLCIIDDADKLINHGQIAVPFLSAQDLIYITYNINITRRSQRLTTCRNFKNFKEQDFLSEVGECDWADLMSSDCLANEVQIFINDRLLNCLNNHAPLKQICFKNLPAPWLTAEIRGAMHERNILRRIWRRNKNIASYERFKAMRNHAQNLIRIAKSNYYLTFFSQKDKLTLIWRKLRHLGLIKAKGSIGCLSHSVEELNSYFADIGTRQTDASIEEPDALDLSEAIFDDEKFYFDYIAPDTIRRSLGRIKSNAIGVDNISSRLISMTLPVIMPIIEHLFNFSVMHGIVPAIWKSAIITPIPKIKPCL